MRSVNEVSPFWNCGIFVLSWAICGWQGQVSESVQGFISDKNAKVSPGCRQDLVCETGWWPRASPSPLVLASSTSLCWSSSSSFWSLFSSSHTGEALRGIIVTLSSKCIWITCCLLRHSCLLAVPISCCVTTCNSHQMYFQHFSSAGFQITFTHYHDTFVNALKASIKQRKVHFSCDVYFERVLHEHMVADGRFPWNGGMGPGSQSILENWSHPTCMTSQQ